MSNQLRNQRDRAVGSALILSDEENRKLSTVGYCNYCGHSMSDSRSFVVEYWRSDQTVYYCWCHSCGQRWEMAEVTKITMMELENGDEDLL
jgi:hypothetical protein